jgi:hypothetical protein
LLELALEAGNKRFDRATDRCLISRDTFWYALALLLDEGLEERAEANRLFLTVPVEDSTHTPATFLAMLLQIPEKLDPGVRQRLEELVRNALPGAAACEMHDGNVNHPLAAYATLLLGGERSGEAWAVDLGERRLRDFRARIGEHRSLTRRQAEMSEYNSLTYTALDLWFLALIAEHAVTSSARSVAAFLEERLWVDVAMHFHAPSQQFAGPHSRSYADDSFGGCSALHFTMLAAFDEPLFIEPELCERYNHPSTLIQNALVAILPFHLPEQARDIAWRKPFPYVFRKTTYGESYHENSRRLAAPAAAGHGAFVFDDEVYPGGWSDLTTFMTEEYALGSAATPYVNGGHSDSVMLRVRRHEETTGLADIRSAWTRGVYNGAKPGERNTAHVPRTEIDESYLYEEGRPVTYQNRHRLLVCYNPKRAGHLGVQSFRTDLIFSYSAPFDALLVDGTPAGTFPIRCAAGVPICFRDFRTFGSVLPFTPVPSASDQPVVIWRCGEFLVISVYNYDGAATDFTRHEINRWRSGFALELATDAETSWQAFVDNAATVRVEESTEEGSLRSVRYRSGGDTMALVYDPFRELIVSRSWNGASDEEDHFTVIAAGETYGPFCPTTLFGSEAMS